MTDDEKRALREAFGQFATGVTVVTTRQPDGTPRGFTANSFTSVSLDPPLLLVCIAKSAHSCAVFGEAEHFGVNVLCEDQKDISGLFASRAQDKFQQIDWIEGTGGVPLLPGSVAMFACVQHQRIDAGDHVVLIGRVLDSTVNTAPPLGYHRGSYFSIGLEDKLVSAAARAGDVSIGAIMEQNGAILLVRNADGTVTVPDAPDHSVSLPGLTERMTRAGLTPQLDHLYAVYDDADRARHAIVYHGTVSGPAPKGMFFCPLEEIPLNRVVSAPERAMLARYAQEYRHGQFGIYQGDAQRGIVHKVSGRETSDL
ncbi:flavin reductase family protein [Rhodobacteraceae bacterium KMM 6894]|nr:flavin reductase family protein [Rhodobacteraceae bacterium KMM 6894]